MPSCAPMSQCGDPLVLLRRSANGSPSSMPTHQRRSSTLSLSSAPSGTSGEGTFGSISSSVAQARRRPARWPRWPARSSSPSTRLLSVSWSAVATSFSRRASPTWRERTFTSARRRSASWSRCAMLDVERHDLVHVGARDAAPRQGGLHHLGFAAQLDEIDHARQPTEAPIWRARGEPVGSRVVSNAVEVNHLRVGFGDRRGGRRRQPHRRLRRGGHAARPQRRRQDHRSSRPCWDFARPPRAPCASTASTRAATTREVVARTGALLQRGGVWFPMTPRQVLRAHRRATTRRRATRANCSALLDLERCAPHAVAAPERRRAAAHAARRSPCVGRPAGPGARRTHHRGRPRRPPGDPRHHQRRARARMRAAASPPTNSSRPSAWPTAWSS